MAQNPNPPTSPVTYADAAGTQLLRDLMREGIDIAACSSFLAELLHLDD